MPFIFTEFWNATEDLPPQLEIYLVYVEPLSRTSIKVSVWFISEMKRYCDQPTTWKNTFLWESSAITVDVLTLLSFPLPNEIKRKVWEMTHTYTSREFIWLSATLTKGRRKTVLSNIVLIFQFPHTCLPSLDVFPTFRHIKKQSIRVPTAKNNVYTVWWNILNDRKRISL